MDVTERETVIVVWNYTKETLPAPAVPVLVTTPSGVRECILLVVKTFRYKTTMLWSPSNKAMSTFQLEGTWWRVMPHGPTYAAPSR